MTSRREFLASTLATAVLGRIAPATLGRMPVRDARVIVIDDHCILPESTAGFRAALSNIEILQGTLVILPATARIPPHVAGLLDDGATVIVESGAAYAGRDGERNLFGIGIGDPVSLWPATGIPYVRYTWPRAAMVRDFSRVVPLRAKGAEVIATVNGLPVGLARRCGRGTLIVLGAPLGPALLFGDSEARRWLGDVVGLDPRSSARCEGLPTTYSPTAD